MSKTYEQLTREIAALQRAAAEILSTEKKSVISKVNALIATYEITASELAFAQSLSSATSGSRSRAKAPAASGARYRDDAGNVWGGRGPRPVWLRAALAVGKTLESFLVTTSPRLSASSPATANPAVKASAAKAQPGIAKFADPKSGQRWGGRGPRPAWLKQALKKRGARIEDFAVIGGEPTPAPIAAPAPSVQAARPAAQVKAKRRSPAKSAVATKPAAVAKKVVRAKTPAAKTPGRKAATPTEPTASKSSDVARKTTATKAAKTAKKASGKKRVTKKAAATEVTSPAARKAVPAKRASVPKAPVAKRARSKAASQTHNDAAAPTPLVAATSPETSSAQATV